MEWSRYNHLFKSPKYGNLLYNTLTQALIRIPETNGVPVDCPYVHVSGDMNRLLLPGRHTFRWRNDLDWPGHAIRTPDCRSW